MTTPRLGAPELATSQANKEETVNEQIRYIEAGAGHFIFKDRDVADPTTLTPSDGDCYLVAASGVDEWTGHDGDIAFRVNTAWAYITPIEGFTAWINDENFFIGYDGAAWNTIAAPSGAYLAAANNLSDVANAATSRTNLGLGTAAVASLDIDDTLAADSDTAVPSQQAIKAYVDNEIAGIGAGPSETTAAEYRAGTQAGEYISPDVAWDAAAYVALNDSGGNIAVDLSTGLNFTMTMDGDYTLSAPSNGKPGQTGVIVLTQDGTGTQTLAYNAAWKFAGGTDPVLSTAAASVDLLFYQVLPNGTDVYANLVKAVA